MKKILALILTLALAVSLAACGGTENQSGSSSTASNASSQGAQSGTNQDSGKEESKGTSDAPAKLLTPEEIFDLLDSTVSVRLIVSANFPGTLTMNTVMERTGEAYRVCANLAQESGASSSEVFLYRDGETYYQILKDASGNWQKTEATVDASDPMGISDLATLFNSAAYGHPDENGSYTMVDSFTFDFQHIAFGNGTLVQKDGVYTVTMTGTMEGTEGTLQVIIDSVDSTRVTLPDVE